MKLERYELKAGENLTTFEFISEGPKGKISKLIQFSPTNLKDLYNLAFGDKDLNSGEINDLTISNNGDSEKILATVVALVYAFTNKNPDVWIYATGSTNRARGFIKWVFLNILNLLRAIILFSDNIKTNGSHLRKA